MQPYLLARFGRIAYQKRRVEDRPGLSFGREPAVPLTLSSRSLFMLCVLIVEDTLDRQATLMSLYRDHAWILVHTARRACRMLDAYDFDLVSLDYNLAGPGDGTTIAAHLRGSR